MLGNHDVKNLSLFALAFWAFFALATAQAQTGARAVWPTDHNSWLDEVPAGDKGKCIPNQTWKECYSSWIRNDLTANIFTAPDSPLFGMDVYCSTAAESLYILFAYENHLPFYLTGKNGKAISNEMPFCNGGEGDLKCFRKFLTQYIDNGAPQVDTETLSRDTYPVSIDRKSVKPGQILLYFSHGKVAADGRPIVDHTHTLVDVTGAGVPHFLSASSLGKPQILTELRGIQDPPYTNGQDGLRDWWTYKYNPSTRQYFREHLQDEPGSREYAAAHGEHYVDQYTEINHANWGEGFTEKLAKFGQSSTSKLIDLYRSLCDSVQQRETYVNDADAVFSRTNQCPNADQWERFSTVAKDERIWNLFKRIDEIVKTWRPDQLNKDRAPGDFDYQSYPQIVAKRNQYYAACKIESIDPRLNLLWLREIYRKRLASADPEDTPKGDDASHGINKRWGLTGEVDLSQAPPQRSYDEDWPAKYDANYIVSYNSCPLAQGSKQPSIMDSSFEKASNSVTDVNSNFRPPAPVAPAPYVQTPAAKPFMPEPMPAPAAPRPNTTYVPQAEGLN